MRAVLEHPLGLLSWSLGNSDRTLKKTSKASLTRQLERNVSFSDEIPQPSTCFIDGISLVQKAHGEGKTFGELSESIRVCALRISSDSDRIDVVFDVYRHFINQICRACSPWIRERSSLYRHYKRPQGQAVVANALVIREQSELHQVSCQ